MTCDRHDEGEELAQGHDRPPSLSALLDDVEECDVDVDVVDYHQVAQDGLNQDIVMKSTDHNNLWFWKAQTIKICDFEKHRP